MRKIIPCEGLHQAGELNRKLKQAPEDFVNTAIALKDLPTTRTLIWTLVIEDTLKFKVRNIGAGIRVLEIGEKI